MDTGSILGTNGGFFEAGTSWVDTKVWWLRENGGTGRGDV